MQWSESKISHNVIVLSPCSRVMKMFPPVLLANDLTEFVVCEEKDKVIVREEVFLNQSLPKSMIRFLKFVVYLKTSVSDTIQL